MSSTQDSASQNTQPEASIRGDEAYIILKRNNGRSEVKSGPHSPSHAVEIKKSMESQLNGEPTNRSWQLPRDVTEVLVTSEIHRHLAGLG